MFKLLRTVFSYRRSFIVCTATLTNKQFEEKLEALDKRVFLQQQEATDLITRLQRLQQSYPIWKPNLQAVITLVNNYIQDYRYTDSAVIELPQNFSEYTIGILRDNGFTVVVDPIFDREIYGGDMIKTNRYGVWLHLQDHLKH